VNTSFNGPGQTLLLLLCFACFLLALLALRGCWMGTFRRSARPNQATTPQPVVITKAPEAKQLN
jgi:hypothetical protein